MSKARAFQTATTQRAQATRRREFLIRSRIHCTIDIQIVARAPLVRSTPPPSQRFGFRLSVPACIDRRVQQSLPTIISDRLHRRALRRPPCQNRTLRHRLSCSTSRSNTLFPVRLLSISQTSSGSSTSASVSNRLSCAMNVALHVLAMAIRRRRPMFPVAPRRHCRRVDRPRLPQRLARHRLARRCRRRPWLQPSRW